MEKLNISGKAEILDLITRAVQRGFSVRIEPVNEGGPEAIFSLEIEMDNYRALLLVQDSEYEPLKVRNWLTDNEIKIYTKVYEAGNEG